MNWILVRKGEKSNSYFNGDLFCEDVSNKFESMIELAYRYDNEGRAWEDRMDLHKMFGVWVFVKAVEI